MVIRKVELLRAACCIAGLDQQISDEEQKLIDKLAKHAGVGAVSVEAMKDRAKSDPDFFEELFEDLKVNADQTMKILFMVACADKELTSEERIVLYHFAQRLNMTDERFNQLMRAAHKKVEEG